MYTKTQQWALLQLGLHGPCTRADRGGGLHRDGPQHSGAAPEQNGGDELAAAQLHVCHGRRTARERVLIAARGRASVKPGRAKQGALGRWDGVQRGARRRMPLMAAVGGAPAMPQTPHPTATQLQPTAAHSQPPSRLQLRTCSRSSRWRASWPHVPHTRASWHCAACRAATSCSRRRQQTHSAHRPNKPCNSIEAQTACGPTPCITIMLASCC